MPLVSWLPHFHLLCLVESIEKKKGKQKLKKETNNSCSEMILIDGMY